MGRCKLLIVAIAGIAVGCGDDTLPLSSYEDYDVGVWFNPPGAQPQVSSALSAARQPADGLRLNMPSPSNIRRGRGDTFVAPTARGRPATKKFGERW